MRFLTVRSDGRVIPCAVRNVDRLVRMDEAAQRAGLGGVETMEDVIRLWSADRDRVRTAVEAAPDAATLRTGDVEILPPVPRPGKLLCLAGNYREHIVESGFAAVGERDVITPQMFLKPSTCLTGDGAAVRLSPVNVRVGWEAELAVVIGHAGRHIAEAEAQAHVFGYTIVNDLSERGLHQGMPGRRIRERDPFFDWLAGKWFDGFAPCGPWIVTADEIPDPHALGIRLRVNGEPRQEGTTADMIFRVPRLIAEASAIMTLEPGDIIATGTPARAGIGIGESFLRPGDRVECEIDGIGVLRTVIVGAA